MSFAIREQKQNLNNHIAAIHDKTKRKHSDCLICDKTYLASSMPQHMREVHDGVKP